MTSETQRGNNDHSRNISPSSVWHELVRSAENLPRVCLNPWNRPRMFRRTLCLRQLALISQRTIRPCSALERATRKTCFSADKSRPVQTRNYTIQTAPDVSEKSIAAPEQTTNQDDHPNTYETAHDGVEQSSPLATRHILRQAIKWHSKNKPPNWPLVEPKRQYPRRSETRRSHSKHINSLRTQSHHEIKRLARGAPEHDLEETLSLLMRNTPAFERVFSLKLSVSKDAAGEFRQSLLSGIDTNVWLIAKRHQSVIRVDMEHNDRDISVSLSGSEIAVRSSLLDILRTVGQVTAVRVPDDGLRAMFARDWEKSGDQTTSRVKLLGPHEKSTSAKMLTILDETIYTPNTSGGSHLYREICEIVQPPVWTKWSFEKHVAALTHSKPSNSAGVEQRFLVGGNSHQEIVAKRLVKLFESEAARQAISLSALKQALSYLQNKGPGFRPATERIVFQMELRDLPADAETYTILLVGASRVDDLASYTSVLKTMIRKQYKPQGRAWVAFLEMIKDRRYQLKVLAAMRRKGLDRIQSTRDAMARHWVLIYLEAELTRRLRTTSTEANRRHPAASEISHSNRSQPDGFPISSFLAKQDHEFGESWLDTITLNKMLEILGRSGEHQACRYLMNTVIATKRTTPDEATLNTMLVHQPDMKATIAVLQSMLPAHPRIKLDKLSYHILFSRAWKLYKPFVLSVIWRYAVIEGEVDSGVANRLHDLLISSRQAQSSATQQKRQKWIPIIFPEGQFREAYDTARAESKDVTYQYFMEALLNKTLDRVPAVNLAQKLQEAMKAEVESRQVVREQQSHLLREQVESFYVDIPLKSSTSDRSTAGKPSVRQLNSETDGQRVGVSELKATRHQ